MQERHKAAASVALALAAFAVFAYLFLEIEQQWEVVALAIGAIAALLIFRKSGIAARVERSAAANHRTAVMLTVTAC